MLICYYISISLKYIVFHKSNALESVQATLISAFTHFECRNDGNELPFSFWLNNYTPHAYLCAHYHYAMPLSYIKSLHTCSTSTRTINRCFLYCHVQLKVKRIQKIIKLTHPLLSETIERCITYMHVSSHPHSSRDATDKT